MATHRLLRFQENFEALVTALAGAVPADQRSEAQQQLLSEAQRQVVMLHQADCVLTAEPTAARERRIARNRRELAAVVEQLHVQPVVILPLKTGADLGLAKEHQA